MTMLDKAVIERVVFGNKDIHQYRKENNLTSPAQMPYFEGDYWPTLLEDSIKEFEQEEEKNQNKKSAEADEAPEETLEAIEAPSAKKKKKEETSNQKIKQKSKTSSQQKSNNNKCVSNEDKLTTKLFETMEIHKDVSRANLPYFLFSSLNI